MLGGWHCAGMCGPLATLVTSKVEIFFYHLGRLFIYLTLGIVAGLLGARFLGWIPPWAHLVFSLLLAAWAFWIFYHSWKPGASGFLSQVFRKTHSVQNRNSRALVLGLLNGLLPCGLLLSFLVAGASSGSILRSGVLLACLWSGSALWLLIFSRIGLNLKRVAIRNPWIERVLFVAVLLGLLAQNLPHFE